MKVSQSLLSLLLASLASPILAQSPAPAGTTSLAPNPNGPGQVLYIKDEKHSEGFWEDNKNAIAVAVIGGTLGHILAAPPLSYINKKMAGAPKPAAPAVPAAVGTAPTSDATLVPPVGQTTDKTSEKPGAPVGGTIPAARSPVYHYRPRLSTFRRRRRFR